MEKSVFIIVCEISYVIVIVIFLCYCNGKNVLQIVFVTALLYFMSMSMNHVTFFITDSFQVTGQINNTAQHELHPLSYHIAIYASFCFKSR